MTKDLYAILGVLPDAEAEVIRAVYLALAKKYHPDSSGNADNEDKLKEINAAYETLSDPKQRRKYDDTRSEQSDAAGEYEPDVDDEDLTVDELQADWEFAVEYQPELEMLLKEVAAISPTLSIVFQSTVLKNKAFSSAVEIKEALILEFFTRYFGNDETIISFVKSLLMVKEMGAAKELNRAVKIFGDDIEALTTIERIRNKFELGSDDEFSWAKMGY